MRSQLEGLQDESSEEKPELRMDKARREIIDQLLEVFYPIPKNLPEAERVELEKRRMDIVVQEKWDTMKHSHLEALRDNFPHLRKLKDSVY